MASFALEDFVGNGALRPIIEALVDDGWDDVPTLKIMSEDDMDALNLNQQQRRALEIRKYLHDRALMMYADKLEGTGKSLADLLAEPPTALSSYGMRRGHVAKFLDRSLTASISMPGELTLRRRKSMSTSPPISVSSGGTGSFDDADGGETKAGPAASKGIVAAAPPTRRLCGLISGPHVADNVTPVELLEAISVQRVTPEHRKGVDPWSAYLGLPPPMKAGELWASRPALLFIVRRPGCVMCRAEAHQLYARKPIFDAFGINLVAVIGEYIETEVRAFWPRYWGGMVVIDTNRDFFRALGGGTLPRDNLITGFCFNPPAIVNYKRANGSGLQGNLKGEGLIKGGLYIIRPRKGGVAYQFVERNIGDWAPLDEVLRVCESLQQKPLMDRTNVD